MKIFEIISKRNCSIKQVSKPSPGTNEILINVKFCGICSTDLRIFNGQYPVNYPLVPGHEFSGIVDEVGKNVKKFKRKDRVVVDPNISCGKCYYCKKYKPNFCENWKAIGVTQNGAYAEYVLAPEANVYHLPKNLSFAEATFIEPISCIIHGLRRARLERKDKVLITGLGPIGLIFGQLVKGSGGIIIGADFVANKLKMAKRLGFDEIINLKKESQEGKVKERTDEKGVDLVVEASGSVEAIKNAFKVVAKSGKILIFGVTSKETVLPFRPFDIYEREIEIIGSFINPYTFSKAIELLSLGEVKVKELISKIIDFDKIEKTLKELESQKWIKCLISV